MLSGGLFMYAFCVQDSETSENYEPEQQIIEEPEIEPVYGEDIDDFVIIFTEQLEPEIPPESLNISSTDDFCINGSWIYSHFVVEDGVQYRYPNPEYLLEISDGFFRITTGADTIIKIYEGFLTQISKYEFLVTVTSMEINEGIAPAIRDNLVFIYHPEIMQIEAKSLFQTEEGYSGVDYFFSRWD